MTEADIKSHVLNQLSHPGAPLAECFCFCFFCFREREGGRGSSEQKAERERIPVGAEGMGEEREKIRAHLKQDLCFFT